MKNKISHTFRMLIITTTAVCASCLPNLCPRCCSFCRGSCSACSRDWYYCCAYCCGLFAVVAVPSAAVPASDVPATAPGIVAHIAADSLLSLLFRLPLFLLQVFQQLFLELSRTLLRIICCRCCSFCRGSCSGCSRYWYNCCAYCCGFFAVVAVPSAAVHASNVPATAPGIVAHIAADSLLSLQFLLLLILLQLFL